LRVRNRKLFIRESKGATLAMTVKVVEGLGRMKSKELSFGGLFCHYVTYNNWVKG
jgi:hypothetical protein